MTFTERMWESARQKKGTLVLPEGTEPRTVKACSPILTEGLAKEVILLGKEGEIKKVAEAEGADLTGITIIDPTTSERLEGYAQEYYELRKHKGISIEDAKAKIIDPLHFGAMMVRKGDATAMVAGAENATGKVLVAAFTIIKTAPGVKSASSCFVMDMPDKKWGKDGLMIFSDCATIPDPTAEQLAEIAAAAAKSCKDFLQTEPKVAMLSFSTKGSAKHEHAQKVIDALAIVKEKHPELNVDGEMQADAAIIPSVAEKKAPGSPVAGQANTLVFPDLQSGNIGYKLVQRFAGADAYGPFLQGFAKPVSDLSRGCSVEEIINTSAATLAQAE
ncbi:phosphate acetyltransferase [Spirochaeta cellobiosiphila]|uniref:phosphate acetyltransferase n=1 Tax=Spirochaeta cellobiosiphila TaxID=504483 RepID=UPI0003FA1587|nr:phosphate acetyltransferase [Spirochaeta cellobiosiphila]